MLELLHRLQAAGEQQLADQVVELRDVARDRVAEVGSPRPHELERHPDAGQRRAQLVRRAREQGTLRAHQGLDPVGRAIEGLGQDRHLVAAFHGHAGVEVARPQALHPRPQPLQPARQPSGDGIGADGHRHRQGGENGQQPDVLHPPMLLARDEPAAVGQAQEPDRTASGGHPPALVPVAARKGKRLAGGGQGLPVGAPQREVQPKRSGQPAQRRLLLGAGAGR